MTEREKAIAFYLIGATLSFFSLSGLAWLLQGFRLDQARWWEWLVAYVQTSGALPQPLVYAVGGAAAVGVLFVALNPWSLKHRDYGSADWATMREIKRMGVMDKAGVVLGALGRRLLLSSKPLTTLVVAPAGTGKTAGTAVPTLLSFSGIVLVNDPKGELYDLSARWRAARGQVVRLDWSNPNGDRWNPLDAAGLPAEPAELELVIDRFSAVLVRPDNGKEADHWIKTGRDALSAATLFNHLVCKDAGRSATYAGILSWFADLSKCDDEEISDPVGFNLELAADHAEAKAWPKRVADGLRTLAATSHKERSGIISTINTGLSVFRNSTVAAVTSSSSLNLREVLSGTIKEATIYVVVPPADQDVYGPVSGLLIEYFTRIAVSRPQPRKANSLKAGLRRLFRLPAPKHSSRPPVLVLLDECALLPRLWAIESGPAIGRGANVAFVLICQSLGQIEARYGAAQLKTILTNTAYLLVLSQNETTTQKMISETIGHTTRKRVSVSRSRGFGKAGGRNDSESREGVPLVRPEDVGALPFGQAILLVQNFRRRPVLVRTPLYFKHSVLKRRAEKGR